MAEPLNRNQSLKIATLCHHVQFVVSINPVALLVSIRIYKGYCNRVFLKRVLLAMLLLVCIDIY